MGQTLSEPATEKHTEDGGDERFHYAVSEMQGWRITMEDAHSTILDLGENQAPEKHSFFAVYDGHGGASVARFAGKTVYKRLIATEPYKEKDYKAALKRAFLGTDEDLRADPSFRHDPSGCTAIALLITEDNKIFAANAGDSRSVLCSAGKVKPLSFDHKPHNEIEIKRIRAAGGFVEFGRVNGNLALSRALGDFEYKKNLSLEAEKQIVTSDPDITEHQIVDEDEFIVIACDGIWDCMGSQQVCDYVRRHAAQRMPLGEICESLVDYCMAPDADLEKSGVGCDNMTVIVVAILHGRTLEQWYDWVVERVENSHGYATPTQFQPLYRRAGIYRGGLSFQRGAGGDRDGINLSSMARAFDLRLPVYSNSFDDMDSSDDENMDDDDDDEEEEGADKPDEAPEGSKSLKAQLDELNGKLKEGEAGEAGPSGSEGASASASVPDGDVQMGSAEDSESANSEGSGLPPGFTSQRVTSVGSPLVSTPPALKDVGGPKPEKQLKSEPGGDKPSGAVKVEGFMDGSEDPMKM